MLPQTHAILTEHAHDVAHTVSCNMTLNERAALRQRLEQRIALLEQTDLSTAALLKRGLTSKSVKLNIAGSFCEQTGLRADCGGVDVNFNMCKSLWPIFVSKKCCILSQT